MSEDGDFESPPDPGRSYTPPEPDGQYNGDPDGDPIRAHMVDMMNSDERRTVEYTSLSNLEAITLVTGLVSFAEERAREVGSTDNVQTHVALDLAKRAEQQTPRITERMDEIEQSGIEHPKQHANNIDDLAAGVGHSVLNFVSPAFIQGAMVFALLIQLGFLWSYGGLSNLNIGLATVTVIFITLTLGISIGAKGILGR